MISPHVSFISSISTVVVDMGCMHPPRHTNTHMHVHNMASRWLIYCYNTFDDFKPHVFPLNTLLSLFNQSLHLPYLDDTVYFYNAKYSFSLILKVFLISRAITIHLLDIFTSVSNSYFKRKCPEYLPFWLHASSFLPIVCIIKHTLWLCA